MHVQCFAEGGDMSSVMQHEVDLLSLIPCVERIQEGEHSRVHRATALRKVSGAYVACVQRKTDLEEVMRHEDDRLALCQAFAKLKTIHTIAAQFHFQDHPLWRKALAEVACGNKVSKHKVATQIMYGLDPLTAHTSMEHTRKKHGQRVGHHLRLKRRWQKFFFPADPGPGGAGPGALMLAHLQATLKPGLLYSMPRRLLQTHRLDQSLESVHAGQDQRGPGGPEEFHSPRILYEV